MTTKYEYIDNGEPAFTKNALDLSQPQKTQEKADGEEAGIRKSRVERIRLFTAIPVIFIALAEILIFLNRTSIAVWVHIGTLIALSLSNLFIRDSEINKIHQALMLLPVLRLINLSMPVFFETTLYTFIFIYGSLIIPVVVIIMHQRSSLEEIGITLKHIGGYIILSIPLGFLLGLGEFLTIRTGYLIPDLSFENLLKLSIIMILFVGLVEELIFRSILQTRLEQALSSKEALLITSILFGLMHSGYGTFYEILYTGFVGLFIGFAFYKTRSLPFVAVLHGCVNVFLFGILPHLYGSRIGF
ncbi:MAG TPA: CPBP family intramembrane glutamic endopeptidase [Methanosarcina sp.]|nr:CPBP family intramembrane glutamic endopeptidase [Methanosarcina sp.]